MKINFSADVYEDSGLYELIKDLPLTKYFKNRKYGNDDVEIFFVINCIGENTKLRKRYDSRGKVLYWDVILPYKKIKDENINEKKAILANAIINSFDILNGYKKLNIDKIKLKEDTKIFFESLGWLINPN